MGNKRRREGLNWRARMQVSVCVADRVSNFV
jgi:hypothetical protein